MKNIKVSLYISTSDSFDIEKWACKDKLGSELMAERSEIMAQMNVIARDNILGWERFEDLRLKGHDLYSRIVDIGEEVYRKQTGFSLLPVEGEIFSLYIDSTGGQELIEALSEIKEKITEVQKKYGTENTDFYIETESGMFAETTKPGELP